MSEILGLTLRHANREDEKSIVPVGSEVDRRELFYCHKRFVQSVARMSSMRLTDLMSILGMWKGPLNMLPLAVWATVPSRWR